MLVYIYIVFGFFYLKGAHVMSSCVEGSPTISSTQVARMCHNSVVTGTRVYIDAEDAGSTTLLSGVACTCTVSIKVGKKMNVQSNFTANANPMCGTTMEYTGQGLSGGILSHSCDDSTFDVTTHTYSNITLGLRKNQTPYLSTYCVSFEFLSCGTGEFQCNSGECIPEASTCDANPDCPDDSDENCGGMKLICGEGRMPCPGGQACMAPENLCNGASDCGDGSDEANCNSTTGISTTAVSPTNHLSQPLITVTCTKSGFLQPLTTISTTTTTTTTTTTSASPTSLTSAKSPSSNNATPSSVLSPTPPYTTTETVRTDTLPTPDTTPPWLIIVIVVPVIVTIAIVFAVICYCKGKNKQPQRESNQANRN